MCVCVCVCFSVSHIDKKKGHVCMYTDGVIMDATFGL